MIDSDNDNISIIQFLKASCSISFSPLIILFALPFLIPLPGILKQILALPLLLCAIPYALDHSNPWIPKFIGNYQIEREKAAKLIEKIYNLLNTTKGIIKPRFYNFVINIGTKLVIFFTLINTIIIFLPIPTYSISCCIGLIIMHLGFIKRDCIVLILGVSISLFGITFSIINLI